MKTKKIKLLVIFAAVFIAGIFAFQKAKESDTAGELVIGNDHKEESVPQESDTSSSATVPVECTAYICGEVKEPGVYKVTSGSRISDLVEKAGGMTKDADLTSVNLAREVTDGEQIIIGSLKGGHPSLGAIENASQSAGQASLAGTLVNINIADKTALMSLPGIGETRAEAIISYRNENGFFKTKEDIKKVSGIKDGSYEKIKDLITI